MDQGILSTMGINNDLSRVDVADSQGVDGGDAAKDVHHLQNRDSSSEINIFNFGLTYKSVTSRYNSSSKFIFHCDLYPTKIGHSKGKTPNGMNMVPVKLTLNCQIVKFDKNLNSSILIC